MNMNIKIITLLLTRRCNLRCSYCYVRYDANAVMPFKIAKKIITNEMLLAKNTKLVISFLGGEPFCEFDRLKEICEWIWSRQWNVSYSINAVTNGTLLTNEIKKWLAENQNRFFLTLSYDGVFNAQNDNRCNSAHVIDIGFFKEHWPTIPFKMTISEDNVRYLFDNIVYLLERKISVNDTFADNMAEWKKESLDILDEQLKKLCLYHLTHIDARPSDILNIDLSPVLSDAPRTLFDCGAGQNKVTYDIDGKSYNCHLLSPLALSEEQLDFLDHDIKHPQISEKCTYCNLDSICPACAGMSFLSNNTCWLRERKNCSLFRHQVYWACYYQIRTILNKKKRGIEIDEHDRLIFLSIKRIMSNNDNLLM